MFSQVDQSTPSDFGSKVKRLCKVKKQKGTADLVKVIRGLWPKILVGTTSERISVSEMKRFLVLLFLVILASFITVVECAVVLSLDKEIAAVNTTISVDCTVSGGETFLGWYKIGTNARQLTTKVADRIYYASEADRHTLNFVKIQESDWGEYECRTTAGSKKTFTLSILFAFLKPVEKTQYLRLYTSAVIQITVIGQGPRPTVTWKDKDDKVLQISANSRYELLPSGSLRIKKVAKSDAGKYTCEIKQSHRRSVEEINVITFLPPVILRPPHPERRYVTAGYNTSFRCIVDGLPRPKIEWLDPSNREVSLFNPRYHVDNETFFIYDVQKSDKGKWTCKVSQGNSVVTASAEIIDVYEAPKIIQPEFPWVYHPPELFKAYTIACKASGYPKPMVVIRKDGRIHPRLSTIPGEAYVSFYLVRIHDLGNYSCEAWSSARDSNGEVIVVNQTFAVYYKDKPFINDQGSPKVIYSYVGNPKPLMINCDFVSWPLANVTIWRGFYELTNGTDQATLYVWTYSWEDFGPYSCIGSNIYGEVNYTVFIKHATPPSKPTKIKVHSTCDRANITWDPPDNTGGMEIDRYVIETKSPRAEKFNTNDSYPEWKINDLKPNTEYRISLRALNRQGKGQEAIIFFRTNSTCVPKRPIVFSPVEGILDRTWLDLRWKVPDNVPKSEKLWYKIIVKEKEDYEEIGHIKVYSSLEPVQRIGGLRKNVTYQFQLFAMDEQEERSEPTYVDYFVAADALDSAHALSASFWCVLLGLLISFSR